MWECQAGSPASHAACCSLTLSLNKISLTSTQPLSLPDLVQMSQGPQTGAVSVPSPVTSDSSSSPRGVCHPSNVSRLPHRSCASLRPMGSAERSKNLHRNDGKG